MGMLTVVILHNDALHCFEQHPEDFGKAIFEGINQANMNHKQATVGFKSYGNYIHVEPSRHADHHALFLSSGNHVSVVGKYEKDWEDLVKRNPDYAKELIKRAKFLLKMAKKSIDEKGTKND